MDDRYSRQLVLPGFGAGGAAATRRGAGARDRRRRSRAARSSPPSPPPASARSASSTTTASSSSNLHRQTIHGTADVGTAKVASAAEPSRRSTPACGRAAYEERLTADERRSQLFADYDLVVDGSDNFATRYLANDAAVHRAGIPLVWGAVSQYGGQAGVACGRSDLPRPVPRCPAADAVLTCEVGGVLPTTVGVIGSIMATEAIKLLTGIGEPLVGRVTTYDALTGRFREIEYARIRTRCARCHDDARSAAATSTESPRRSSRS